MILGLISFFVADNSTQGKLDKGSKEPDKIDFCPP